MATNKYTTNNQPTLVAVSNTDGETPVYLYADPVSHGLVVSASVSIIGGATEAKQEVGNTSLASIDGKIPALGQALAAASVPVVLTAAQLSTLTPPAQGLTDTQLRATAVPVSGTFYQATQPVSLASTTIAGSVAVTNAGITTIAGAVAGTEMQVDVLTMPTVAVTGTFWQATQPISGTIAAVTAITNALPAGTNAIGKLAANSGVDIGDVDVTSLPIPTTIYNGKKTVTTAGTRVTLASSQAVKSIVIKALTTNTGLIYVGDGSVASTTGFVLSPGDTISLDIANLTTVNLDSSVNGEGITYIGSN